MRNAVAVAACLLVAMLALGGNEPAPPGAVPGAVELSVHENASDADVAARAARRVDTDRARRPVAPARRSRAVIRRSSRATPSIRSAQKVRAEAPLAPSGTGPLAPAGTGPARGDRDQRPAQPQKRAADKPKRPVIAPAAPPPAPPLPAPAAVQETRAPAPTVEADGDDDDTAGLPAATGDDEADDADEAGD